MEGKKGGVSKSIVESVQGVAGLFKIVGNGKEERKSQFPQGRSEGEVKKVVSVQRRFFNMP